MNNKVNGVSKISDLKTHAEELVNKVFEKQTTSTVSIITYANSANTVGTYNYNQKNSAVNAIKSLSTDGGTNIYAGITAANTKVNSLTTDNEKVVVFLTDGAPTVPYSEHSLVTNGIYTDNYANGNNNPFTNNTKNKIVEAATTLKQHVKAVYSIGLGTSSLSSTTIGYAEKCDTITGKVEFDKSHHTYTVTLTNPTNSNITLENVDATIKKVESINTPDTVVANNDGSFKVTWSNVTIPANGEKVLNGTYTESYSYGHERTPEGSVALDNSCSSTGHNEQFNNSDLFSVVKTGNDGNKYHCIPTRTYASYLLSKISSTGSIMNVTQVSDAFDEIIEELESAHYTYVVEEGTVIDIPETRTIVGNVKVTVGSNTTEYTIDQLRATVNGLKYIQGQGFKWTITGDTLLTEKLSIAYHISE